MGRGTDRPSGGSVSDTPGPTTAPPARVLVVDAANVVGARPDGWWKDRAGAAARLVGRLALLLERGVLSRHWSDTDDDVVVDASSEAVRASSEAGCTTSSQAEARKTSAQAGRTSSWENPEVVVVLEGRAREADTDGSTTLHLTVVRAAADGDACIVEQVSARAGADVVVVTSDRELRRRIERAGARVRGAGWLRSLTDDTPALPPPPR